MKIHSKILLLRTRNAQIIEHEEVKLVSSWSLFPYGLVLCYRRVLCTLPKEKCKHQAATNSVIYNAVLPVDMLVQWEHKGCGSSQPISELR